MILFARHVGDENVNYMSRNQTFNPCYSAFVVDPSKYTFDITHLSNVSAIEEHTMLLNYNVGNKVCSDAQKDSATFACKGKSYCYDSVEGPKGYLCNCSQGYKGNPYLAYGCQDINECEDENLCKHGCKNTEGSYSCSCPYGNGRKDGIGCSKSFSVLQLSLGVGFGLLFVVIGSFVLCVTIKRRKLKILSTEWWLPINGTDYFKRDLYS